MGLRDFFLKRREYTYIPLFHSINSEKKNEIENISIGLLNTIFIFFFFFLIFLFLYFGRKEINLIDAEQVVHPQVPEKVGGLTSAFLKTSTFSLVKVCSNSEKSIWQKVTIKLVENRFHSFYDNLKLLHIPSRLKIISKEGN